MAKSKEKEVKKDYKDLTQKAIDVIANEGISLTKACERIGINRRFFFEEIKKHKELSNGYARACDIRCDLIADEILDIADSDHLFTEKKNGFDEIKGTWNEQVIKDNSAKRKDMIDARKWLLAKMMPKKYGTQKEELEEKDNVININLKEVLPK